MQEVDCIPFHKTGFFSKLITDYLAQKPELQEFYNRFPTLEKFQEQIKEKSSFPTQNRGVLAEVLTKQYHNLKNSDADISIALQQIEQLRSANCFTVTTGHQLNILTGPLYFIYKIVSTIKLSEKLSKAYPGKNFVPVYWMASEDHDFAEINFINLYGGRLRWEREAGGPVGRMSTAGFEKVIDELEEHLGPGTNSEHLIRLFRKAYQQHANLADATRYLVHQLFGDKGLIIIDADHPELKRLAEPYFKKDLLENSPQKEVEPLTQKLEEQYFKQVHPREINLFYIREGLRERIEQREGKWMVLNTELVFTKDEVLTALKEHPERFSPNVVLRPLLQEVILPNLAYIGGGGELAYWFQLKKMFSTFDVPFPMLVLRNSVLWIDSKRSKKMQELGIEVAQLFQPLHQLQKQLAKENAPMDTELEPYEKELQRIFNELEEVAEMTDQSMLGAVNAQRQKQLNGLEKLRKKLIRAEKRRQKVSMDKVERVHQKLFPGGSLQERYDNLSPYYCEYGENFKDSLLEKLDPLDFRFVVIRDR